MNPPPSSSSPVAASALPTSWFSRILPRGRSDKSGTMIMAASHEAGIPAGPIKGKNQFLGVLFKYRPKPAQVAFKTGEYKQQVIFVGGLTDGFLATEYLEPLAIALDEERWSLVQMLLSSSYVGYGTSSLQQLGSSSVYINTLVALCILLSARNRWAIRLVKDAAEIDQLVSYFINKEDSEGVVLLGHSTGCQAPVSDREYRATLPETARLIDMATTMRNEGRGSEIMPREADPCAPITADRYYSLCAYMGDDDLFNSDQLKTRLGHKSNTPCQVIFSMADEYVPEYVDKKALVERLSSALGGAEKVEIEPGNHSLSNRISDAVQAIIDFIKREGPKGWDYPWS